MKSDLTQARPPGLKDLLIRNRVTLVQDLAGVSLLVLLMAIALHLPGLI